MNRGVKSHGGGADGQAHGGLHGILAQSGEMGDPGNLGAEVAHSMIELDKMGHEGLVQGLGDDFGRAVVGRDFVLETNCRNSIVSLGLVPLVRRGFPLLRDGGWRGETRPVGNKLIYRRATDRKLEVVSRGLIVVRFTLDTGRSRSSNSREGGTALAVALAAGSCNRGFSLLPRARFSNPLRHVNDD